MPNVCIYAVTPGSKSKHIVKAGKIAKYNILVIKKKVPPPTKKKKNTLKQKTDQFIIVQEFAE